MILHFKQALLGGERRGVRQAYKFFFSEIGSYAEIDIQLPGRYWVFNEEAGKRLPVHKDIDARLATSCVDRQVASSLMKALLAWREQRFSTTHEATDHWAFYLRDEFALQEAFPWTKPFGTRFLLHVTHAEFTWAQERFEESRRPAPGKATHIEYFGS